jgi:hypothetical protein
VTKCRGDRQRKRDGLENWPSRLFIERALGVTPLPLTTVCRDIRGSAVPPLQLPVSLKPPSAPVSQSSYGCSNGILSAIPVTPNGHLTAHGVFSVYTKPFFEWMGRHSGGQRVLFSGSHMICWPAPSSNDHHLAPSPNGHFSRVNDQAIINEIRGSFSAGSKFPTPTRRSLAMGSSMVSVAVNVSQGPLQR